MGVIGVNAGEGGVALNETPELILRRPWGGGSARGGREGERESRDLVPTGGGSES